MHKHHHFRWYVHLYRFGQWREQKEKNVYVEIVKKVEDKYGGQTSEPIYIYNRPVSQPANQPNKQSRPMEWQWNGNEMKRHIATNDKTRSK